jgi:hypothetical protein
MPIVSGDIDFFESTATNGGNISLGGAITANEITSGALHNLFDVVDSTEAASPGQTSYRCFYVKNNHGSLTLQDAKVYFNESTLDGSNSIAMAVAGEGVNGTAETIANEETAPTTGSPSFTTPTSEGAALTIGNIPAGQHQAIWLERTVTGGAPAADALDFSVTVFGDTSA